MQGLRKPISHASFLRKLLGDMLQHNKIVRKRLTRVPGNKELCNSKAVKGSLKMTSVQEA